jgi:hypothetical protein
MDHELNRKLGNIIQEAMLRDGVLPKRAWNPNSKTVAWLRERGFNMGHRTARRHRFDRWGEWSMAYGTQTPRCGQIEGFVETQISFFSSDSWIFVPEDMVEKILVLGCP